MSEPTCGSEPSKSGVKNAKHDAGKAAKKRPDPEGLALIEEGDKALAAKDLGRALELYVAAKARCESSTAQAASKEKKPKPVPAVENPGASAPPAEEERKPRLMLAAPAENSQAKPLREGVDGSHNYAANSEAALAAHLKATGGVYRTRFPPEPNGYLHIGHAKAMNFNFGQARLGREQGVGGETVLRFDDTNPTAEKQEFIDSIQDNVAWLGHTPARITFSSDYFDQLHKLACQLIASGLAYVCHQKPEEVKASRVVLRAYHGAKEPGSVGELPAGATSSYRDRSADENQRHFARMREGRYAEGEAFLRMKGDLHSDNPALWDPAAYRVMFHEHPRTVNAWCIYPTYDFTHCIVDSIENISHSLCTLEFETRQAVDGPYYWLLHSLGLYKPVTWEYSRLNLTHSLMSKRKLKRLVDGGHVTGWDDPRLVTLDGLRRRGFTSSVVNRFCETIGVTRAKMTARSALLEQVARQELDTLSPRYFAVLDPLRVEVAGLPGGEKVFTMRNHPKEDSFGSRELALTESIFIEREDFREVDDPNFFGLALGKEVGLLGAHVNIRCTGVCRDGSGAVSHLTAEVDLERTTKPKGHLHWLSAATAVPAEVRMYGVLFEPEFPEEAAALIKASGGGGDEEADADEVEADAAAASGAPAWLELLNPSSLRVMQAVVEPALRDAATMPARAADRPAFQFQRQGYFCVDTDSSVEHPVFNRIVALKEDKEKKAPPPKRATK